MRVIGLEPTCLTASDPKSDTSANFATPAFKPKAQSLKPKTYPGCNLDFQTNLRNAKIVKIGLKVGLVLVLQLVLIKFTFKFPHFN